MEPNITWGGQNCRAKKIMASSKSETLISELPSPLLCLIISYLPTNEAVATSILSRRWKSLWKYLTRLDFNPLRMVKQPYNYSTISIPRAISNIQEEVLYSQKNSVIHVCRMVLKQGNPSFNELRIWIEYLKEEKRVEELSLIGGEVLTENLIFQFSPPEPVDFFRGRTLRMVELKSLAISDASAFEGCANLETLKFDSVSLTDEVLVKIIFNCIFLENLILINCKELLNLDIRNKRLKYLEAEDLHLIKFELRSESLRFLSLKYVTCVVFKATYVDCPNLNVFRLYSTTSDFLDRLSGIKRNISKGQKISTFPNWNLYNLRALHTSLDLDSLDDNILLRYCFEVCTKLQRLQIINRADEEKSSEHKLIYLAYPESVFWKGHLPDSITHHLKVVEIKGFSGNDREMRLAIHLIRSAPRLDKLVIQFDNACPKFIKEDAERKLLLEPRASLNAPIFLNHEQE